MQFLPRSHGSNSKDFAWDSNPHQLSATGRFLAEHRLCLKAATQQFNEVKVLWLRCTRINNVDVKL